MYKIDRRGEGVQKSYTDPGNFQEMNVWILPPPRHVQIGGRIVLPNYLQTLNY